ncbi:hypothetical protein [Roseateles sp. BYS96W]|uniref:hypothetical protein n=1 Tax=Pelomonas nitida TaxID=3299027 RepID=UPI0037491DCD
MAKLLTEFRSQCEEEGLLSTYEEVHEYHLGEDAYPSYSLSDWLRDAEFRYGVLQGTWEHYRVSLVMAHVASAKAEMDRGKSASANKLLQHAYMLRHDLRGDLPSIYVDPNIEDKRPSQRGGHVKDVNRRCKAILNCLEDNHKLDGKDFKSFDEAVEYAIDMLIAEGQGEDVEKLRRMKRSYPGLFKDWLRLNADDAARFKVCTGIAWSD